MGIKEKNRASASLYNPVEIYDSFATYLLIHFQFSKCNT